MSKVHNFGWIIRLKEKMQGRDRAHLLLDSWHISHNTLVYLEWVKYKYVTKTTSLKQVGAIYPEKHQWGIHSFPAFFNNFNNECIDK